MTRPSLSCDEVEELLPLVADGTLDDVGDPTLFMHLADCERCQQSLVTHDLIAVSLPRAARLPEPRRLRPWWQRALPAAAAASLLLGGAWWAVASSKTALVPGPGPVSLSSAPAAPLAKANLVAAATSPKSVAPKPAAHPGSVDVEVEVVALPGSTTAHPHYLVRRGEQVLLVTPQAALLEAPSDARQASFSPNRY